ncbi:MAG TPA: amidohydrolase family protein, partial [Candidatus Ozemobacteraceae bacterium]|nr:amidohydrolase family protein [Candidatus Ozemobacteraceae bacterium]
FDELRAFRQLADELWPGRFPPAEILKLVTTSPAAIFRVAKQCGSLEAGKLANFLVFPDTQQDPWASFFELTAKSLSLVVHRGALAYGDERFRSVCSVRFDHYSEVLVEGVPKLIWGKPIQLLERIEHKLGESRRFPFLPVNEL